MRAAAVLETCLYCADLAAAEHFYTQVLGLAQVGAVPGRHVFFRCGQSMVLLFNPETTSKADLQEHKVPAHGAVGAGHAAFRVQPEELESWERHLAAHGVAVESRISWPGGGRSIYFRDPSGNSLELATAALWGL